MVVKKQLLLYQVMHYLMLNYLHEKRVRPLLDSAGHTVVQSPKSCPTTRPNSPKVHAAVMKAGRKGHLRAVTSMSSVAILTLLSTAAVWGSMLSSRWENQSGSHADRLDIPEIRVAATSFLETDKHWSGKLPNHKIRISGSRVVTASGVRL